MKKEGIGAQGEAELLNKGESQTWSQVRKNSVEEKTFRVTYCPGLPRLSNFLVYGMSNAKTDKVSGQPGRVGHPT